MKELAETTGISNKVAKQFMEEAAKLAVREDKEERFVRAAGHRTPGRADGKRESVAIPQLAKRLRFLPRR